MVSPGAEFVVSVIVVNVLQVLNEVALFEARVARYRMWVRKNQVTPKPRGSVENRGARERAELGASNMGDPRELQAVLDDWVTCFSAGDIEGATDIYAPDGAIYSPYGTHAVGREALLETHAEWHAAGETNKSVEILEARIDGDLAYAMAKYSGDYPQDDGTSITESGVSLNIFTRQADGGWKIQISSLNSDVPPLAET